MVFIVHMFIFLGIINCFILKDNVSSLFLSRRDSQILLSPYIEEAVDLSIEYTEPPSLSSILSTGTKALMPNKYNTNSNSNNGVTLGNFGRRNKNLFFKVVVTYMGHILQHKDMCVGYSRNWWNKKDKEREDLMMIDCNDVENVIKFSISDRIDGGLVKDYLTSDNPSKYATVDANLGDVKANETGFLRGLYDRVSHYF
jgi:hypothetical protein